MNKTPLIIFSCYHKGGTTLLRNFIIDYCAKHNFIWKEGHCESFDVDDFQEMDIWFDPWGTALVPHDLRKDNRKVEEVTRRKCIGVHLIRDPRNIIVSGYLYHKSQEKEVAWKGRYKETLNSLDQDNGLLFEMGGTARETITRMQKWDYSNNIFLELKYEELILNFAGVFHLILKHINSTDIKGDLEIAQNHDVNLMPRSEVLQNEHIHSKVFDPLKWEKFLKDIHLIKLHELFPCLKSNLFYSPYNPLNDAV